MYARKEKKKLRRDNTQSLIPPHQLAEFPTAKPGDRCPLCGKGRLVPSPSRLNLLCVACNRITVLHETDG